MVDSRQCKLFVPEDKKQYIKGEIGERMAADNFSNSASLQCMHRTLACPSIQAYYDKCSHAESVTGNMADILPSSSLQRDFDSSICTMPDAVTHVGEWCSRRSSWMTHSYLRFTLW